MAPRPIQTQTGKQEVFATSPSGASPAAELRGLGTIAGSAFKAMGDLGSELHDIGVRVAGPEMKARGAAAVERDEEGRATFEPRLAINDFDEAFNAGGIATFAATTEQDIRSKLFEIRQETQDDPEKFRTLSDTYVKTIAGAPGTPSILRSDILNSGRTLVSEHFENMVVKKRARDVVIQGNALESNIDTEVENTLLPLARAGGTNSPEFILSAQKTRNWLNALRNPIYGKSDAEIDNKLQRIEALANAEATLGASLKIYDQHGKDAAVEFADKAFFNPNSHLPLDQAERYHSTLHRKITEIETGKRQADAANSEAIMGRVADAAAAASRGQDWERILPRSTLRAVLGDGADGVIDNLEGIADTHAHTKWVATASPEDIAARVKELDPDNILKSANPAGLSEEKARAAIADLFPGTTVTSGKRTPEHNEKVGGVPNSQHIAAQALDFVLPRGLTFTNVKTALAEKGLPVSELINEGDHVHWAWGAGVKGRGYAADLRRFEALRSAIKGHQECLAEDPAGYVLKTSPYIQALAQQAESGDLHAQKKYSMALLDEQDRLGVPAGRRRVLSKEQADFVTEEMLTAPPAQAVAALARLTAGLEQRELNILGAQIAPKDRAISVAVSLAAQEPGLARDIITGQRFLAENGDAKPSDKVISAMLDKLTAGSRGWMSSTGGLFEFAPDARGAALAAGTAIYARHQIGNKAGTVDQGKLESAMRQILGNPFSFRGQFIVPPRPDMKPAEVADMVRKLDGKAIAAFGNGQPVDAAGRAISAEAIARHGVLTYTGTAGLYRIRFPGQGHLGVKSTTGARTFTLDLGKMIAGPEPEIEPGPVMPAQEVLQPLGKRAPTTMYLKRDLKAAGGRR